MTQEELFEQIRDLKMSRLPHENDFIFDKNNRIIYHIKNFTIIKNGCDYSINTEIFSYIKFNGTSFNNNRIVFDEFHIGYDINYLNERSNYNTSYFHNMDLIDTADFKYFIKCLKPYLLNYDGNSCIKEHLIHRGKMYKYIYTNFTKNDDGVDITIDCRYSAYSNKNRTNFKFNNTTSDKMCILSLDEYSKFTEVKDENVINLFKKYVSDKKVERNYAFTCVFMEYIDRDALLTKLFEGFKKGDIVRVGDHSVGAYCGNQISCGYYIDGTWDNCFECAPIDLLPIDLSSIDKIYYATEDEREKFFEYVDKYNLNKEILLKYGICVSDDLMTASSKYVLEMYSNIQDGKYIAIRNIEFVLNDEEQKVLIDAYIQNYNIFDKKFNTTIELNLASNDYGYVSIHNIITDGEICDELEHEYYYDKNKDDFVYIYDGIFDDCDEDDSDN